MGNHIEMTLTAGCPMKCSYCPQSNYIKGYQNTNTTDKKMMSLEDYKVILSNVNHHVPEVFFTGFTELLGNKQWFDIVNHTIDNGYKTHVNTTLMRASSEDIDKLCQLDRRGVQTRVHLTDSKIKIPESTIREFIQKYPGKLMFDSFTPVGDDVMPADLRHLITRHHAHSRADNLDMEHRVIQGPVRCSGNRQFSNVVLPNGDVSVCCSDFGLKHIMGNLLTTKLVDIHRGETMKAFMNKMNEGDPNFICNHCEYAVPR